MRQGCNADGEVYTGWYVEHERCDAPHEDDGRTRQEFAEECDINNILARYETTGMLSHYNDPARAQYLDLTDMPTDLQGALLYVEMARESFMRLPAIVRKDFDNDPVQFAEFASKPENLDQMREWNLAPPKIVPAPPPTPAAESGPVAPTAAPAS